jgi:hypothetical protein
MEERRQTERVSTSLYTLWDLTHHSVFSGMTTDLSKRGCFVQGHAMVSIEHQVNLLFRTPTERWLLLPATIAHVHGKRGFGVAFDKLPEPERGMVTILLEYYR